DRQAGPEQRRKGDPSGLPRRALRADQDEEGQKVQRQAQRGDQNLRLEEGEGTVERRPRGGEEAGPAAEDEGGDSSDEEQVHDAEQRLEAVDQSVRGAEETVERPEQVGIEGREVERLLSEPFSGGDRFGPAIVDLRIEDQPVEEDAGLRIEIEVDGPEQGGGDQDDRQRSREQPERLRLGRRGRAGAGAGPRRGIALRGGSTPLRPP